MSAIMFGWENGLVIEKRPADEYTVELLGNGYARVDHHRSGIVSLIEPRNGRFRTQQVRMPAALIAEIQRRWGGDVR